jgi:hypothetical protein
MCFVSDCSGGLEMRTKEGSGRIDKIKSGSINCHIAKICAFRCLLHKILYLCGSSLQGLDI